MSAEYPPVPYDPELLPGLAEFLALVQRIPLRADTIPENRAHFATIIPTLDEVVGDRPVTVQDRVVPGPPGAPDIELTIIRPSAEITGAPALYNIHGGGMILGNRFLGAEELVANVLRFGAVGVTVEYRLAPEHPAPAGVEDCYAGLVWLATHAEELGIDPDRIVVTGESAGGGLAAGTALLARDRGGPALAGQLLLCPMLDDRPPTSNTGPRVPNISGLQYDGLGAWDRHNNHVGWTALLGLRYGTDAVSPYAAPSRMTDLSRLPPAFLEVGSAELFRDETTDYALRIWATGGRAELHVWSGGYHGFPISSPDAEVSRAANAARLSWLRRVLR
ncbi:alpha/beta hydrolase [Nocardia panacis]|uniref:Alpha/beta hydrolase n=1 Tax=Nocardia panacis TaxID=2340916 RepID=A0A3A4K9L2_9NOCA|nr:alpha/beta hydrolase fold domain-containing protein [Nocardia panacis]RJO70084.1 alpha/beta hydrolase [Nocardia panacis]